MESSPLLRRVGKLLWTAIFKIVTGESSTIKELELFFSHPIYEECASKPGQPFFNIPTQVREEEGKLSCLGIEELLKPLCSSNQKEKSHS
jgi:hypothetical protein